MTWDEQPLTAEAFAALSAELARTTRVVEEQAGSIAHYKKMYDRSSALARIGVWECDLATEALTWTDGVYDLFELPRGSSVGRARTLELYEPESRKEMERLRAAAITTGRSFSLDIRVCTTSGKPRWLRLTADVEREDGRPVRIFGTKQDITEEREAQEKVRSLQAELIQVSRTSAMGAMAATLAHELNQPLAAIGNYAAGTRRALNRPEPVKEFLDSGLEAIEQCAFRAGNIIRSLRAMTNGSAVRRQPVDPNPMIREAASLAMASAGESAALHFDLAADVALWVDPVQIQQVLINLIRNGVEAMQGSPRREIRVSTRLVDDMIEIRVDDTGPGIVPAELGNLFDTHASSKPGGMGVGLSISRTIVEAHDGRISASNLATGGASFRILLPLGNADQDADFVPQFPARSRA